MTRGVSSRVQRGDLPVNLSLRTSFVKQSKLLKEHTIEYIYKRSFLSERTHSRLPRPLPNYCLVQQ